MRQFDLRVLSDDGLTPTKVASIITHTQKNGHGIGLTHVLAKNLLSVTNYARGLDDVCITILLSYLT